MTPGSGSIFAARLLLSALLVLTLSCGAIENEAVNQDSTDAGKNKPANEFETELNAYKTADFTYVYVFRRKDGKPMDAEDKRFVKENSHLNTNRFTLNQDETVIFAGSNFKFEENGLAALMERFKVEDYSKPVDATKQLRKKTEAADNSNS